MDKNFVAIIGTECSNENLANLLFASDKFSPFPTELIMQKEDSIILFDSKPLGNSKDAKLEIKSIEAKILLLIDINNGRSYMYKGPDPDQELIKHICLISLRLGTLIKGVIDARPSKSKPSFVRVLN